MIAHKVESGRDVILDGNVYKPDHEKLVYLPRVFETDEIVPLVKPAGNIDPVDEAPAAGRNQRNRKAPDVVPDEAPAAGMTGDDIEEALNG